MLKQLLLLTAALAACFFIGVFPAGAAFALACLLVSAPQLPQWYAIILGALASDIAAMLVGDSPLIFWALLSAAVIILSLRSLPRAAALTAAAWLILRFEASPQIYIALFTAVIWNEILLFTMGEKYVIMKNNDKAERNTQLWQEKPTTMKA